MHRIAGELYQIEYQNMRENVSPKNAKNAPWLQIAEYLIFCTRDDKDVHNALLTARKMEITNTNTQKYETEFWIVPFWNDDDFDDGLGVYDDHLLNCPMLDW